MSNDERLPSVDAVMRMATGYLAQRATSTLHLREVLGRRIRKRAAAQGSGSVSDSDMAPILDAVLARLAQAGLLDDASYAASRARTLAAKGLPPWRVRRELADQGLDPDPLGLSGTLDDEAQARRFAERKRLGPFRPAGRLASGDRDLRSLLRAGFSPRVARRVLDHAEDEGVDSEYGMNDP